MTLNCLRIDMQLTDKAVLDVLRKYGSEPLSLQDIAALVGCHRNTAHNAITRLESAGYIRRSYGGGANKTIYEITNAL